MNNYIKFMEVLGNVKHLKRTGWVLRKVKDCETVSGHMYRMAMMSFFLEDSHGLDRIRVMEMSLVHDLAEGIVGDITPYCGVSREEKLLKEFSAMTDIADLLGPNKDRMMALFNSVLRTKDWSVPPDRLHSVQCHLNAIYNFCQEYEEGKTPEAKFVKDLDRLDMVMQAYEYEKRDNCPMNLQEFFDSTENKFSHPFVVDIVNAIKTQRAKTSTTTADNLISKQ